MTYPTLLLRLSSVALLLGLAGCIDPYMPDVVNSSGTLLVVDGFINGNGRTRVRLSRTQNVAATTAPPPERGASLAIVDETGQQYPLKEQSPGYYQSDSLLLPGTRRYHLRIATATKVAYESEPAPLLVTPPIDQVHYQLVNDRVQILLDTHDPTGQTRFYRWRVAETWQFNSFFQSTLAYRDNRMQDRTTPIYTCWRTEDSHRIRQGSTSQLAVPVLTDVLLTEPSGHDERFKVRYSVLVSQMAETAEEFAYWEILRKNTEAVGTVNDPLPSQLTGNVHRLDKPGEAVLGFVGAHTAQQQRLFIDKADLHLPQTWLFDTPYNTCVLDTERFFASGIRIVGWPHTIVFLDTLRSVPVALAFGPHGDSVGYSGGTYQCIDCRARGSNVKPSYW